MSVILVTGASSGFGHLTSLRLARAGHVVYAGMRDPEGRNVGPAGELRRVANAEDLRLHVVALDVRSDESVAAAVGAVLAGEGRVDVLLNNAGVMYMGLAESFSVAQLQDQLDTNLVGAFRVAKAVLPTMRAQKSGLLLHVSSVFGRVPGPFCGPYNAAKAGMEGLFATLAYETYSLGIDTVILEPGPFRTNVGANGVYPNDPTLAAEYGAVAAAFQGWLNGFGQFMAQPIPELEPALFADTVLELVNAPAGSRPLRKTVGLSYGVDALNAATDPFEKGMVTGQQLGFLLER